MTVDSPTQSLSTRGGMYVEYSIPVPPDITIQAVDLEKAGEWLVGTIKARTASGVDFNNQAFAPYSVAYAKRKSSASVDLKSRDGTRHMIDALDYRVSDSSEQTSSLEVGIFNDERSATLAQVHNEGAVLRTGFGMGSEGFKTNPGRRRPEGKKDFLTIPARRFLGANTEDMAAMAEIIVKSESERSV